MCMPASPSPHLPLTLDCWHAAGSGAARLPLTLNLRAPTAAGAGLAGSFTGCMGRVPSLGSAVPAQQGLLQPPYPAAPSEPSATSPPVAAAPAGAPPAVLPPPLWGMRAASVAAVGTSACPDSRSCRSSLGKRRRASCSTSSRNSKSWRPKMPLLSTLKRRWAWQRGKRAHGHRPRSARGPFPRGGSTVRPAASTSPPLIGPLVSSADPRA
jgi:hypothetical protein